MSSQYFIEAHAPWFPGREHDIVVAETDADALRQARSRCPAGDLYRYAAAFRERNARPYVFVARFFRWEFR